MSEAKHTPGNWNLLIRKTDAAKMIVSEDSSMSVCNVTDYGEMPWQANANLIAASPDLLAACKVARDLIGRTKPTLLGLRLFDQLSAAIEKAEGNG